MNAVLHRSDDFIRDFDRQYRWYLEEVNEVVAEGYFAAVQQTLRLLVTQPELGRRRRFRHPELQGIRSFPIRPPYSVHVAFYRFDDAGVTAERLMHGARDLPRRLVEPPTGF